MNDQPRWSDLRYLQLESVRYLGGQIQATFKDGSIATVDASRLLPSTAKHPDWSRMQFDDYEIRVPTASGEAEIPWSTIRALTDGSYSAHLAEQGAEQARLIGQQIKSLRKSRGLTGKDLAERAGITPQSLSRIEHGHHDVVFTTLKRILAAMDCSLSDLVDAGSEAASVHS